MVSCRVVSIAGTADEPLQSADVSTAGLRAGGGWQLVQREGLAVLFSLGCQIVGSNDIIQGEQVVGQDMIGGRRPGGIMERIEIPTYSTADFVNNLPRLVRRLYSAGMAPPLGVLLK